MNKCKRDFLLDDGTCIEMGKLCSKECKYNSAHRKKKIFTKEMKKRLNDRGGRLYNGIPSKLMNEIYDQLVARDETCIEQEWWAIFSLYLARSCGVIEKRQQDEYYYNEKRKDK
jgi:hypothetical protein